MGIYNFSNLNNENSLHDNDVDMNQPLQIGIDYGHHINAMRVGQPHTTDIMTGEKRKEYRFLKTLFVKPPHKLVDLINAFCDYYEPHKNKTVMHYFDHTAMGGEGWRLPHVANTEEYFRNRGWRVIKKYIGKAPDHAIKYDLWNKLLLQKDRDLPQIRFNELNDKEGIRSMQLASVKLKGSGYGKDKGSEGLRSIPREQATDLSDAGDLLICGNYSNLTGKPSEYIGL
jgi:hypothetical protein